MNKLIGILFGGVAAVIDALAGSAVFAFAVLPRMSEGTIQDVARLVIEVADAVRAVGVLAAIEAAAAEVGGELGDGDAEHLSGMHGQGEVDENIRELCAIKNYKENNKFMEYIVCRNKDIRSNDWKPCAVNGIDAAVIENCFNGEGKQMLAENYKIAKALEIGASPTWIANGKNKFSGITAEDIKNNYCRYNPGVAGCEKTLSNDAPQVQGGCGN